MLLKVVVPADHQPPFARMRSSEHIPFVAMFQEGFASVLKLDVDPLTCRGINGTAVWKCRAKVVNTERHAEPVRFEEPRKKDDDLLLADRLPYEATKVWWYRASQVPSCYAILGRFRAARILLAI